MTGVGYIEVKKTERQARETKTMDVGKIAGGFEKIAQKKISGAGGCSSNDQELGGVVGGGAKIPPGADGPKIPGKPDGADFSPEVTGGGGTSDLGSIKELLAGLCK